MGRFSGLMFPVENMPKVLQVVSYSNPLTYSMVLLRNIMLKGGEPGLICQHIAILTVMAIGIGWISIKRFRTTL